MVEEPPLNVKFVFAPTALAVRFTFVPEIVAVTGELATLKALARPVTMEFVVSLCP